ncbi:hypothetical protein POTG_01059 [Paenibacillus sp. oral taxon 786 str. D14]|nr:hypothetical protein POTG_01059 [Paenibacillus sp. oral taxon 786 str. D14]
MFKSKDYVQAIISIHALTRSATPDPLFNRWDHGYFNPRTHKECDFVPFWIIF